MLIKCNIATLAIRHRVIHGVTGIPEVGADAAGRPYRPWSGVLLGPANQAPRTFNQAAEEYSENEAKQLLPKPSKQVQRRT